MFTNLGLILVFFMALSQSFKASVAAELASKGNETEAYEGPNPNLQDTVISCDPYAADECNCVYYARDRQPKLVSGLSTCSDKKHASNSKTGKPGCVLFRTGDPTYCHAAYVTKVSDGKIYYDQANWTPCKCSKDSLPEGSDKIVGFWCP